MLGYFAILLAFEASRLSGLNIGIIEALWSIAPFFVALADWVIHSLRLHIYQLVGMIGLVVMTVFISLSDLFSKDKEDLTVLQDPHRKYPVYKALLLALLHPLTVVFFVQSIRATCKLRLNLIDMSMAYFLISSIVITVPSLIMFATTSVNFSWYYFWQGFGGSVASCIGATLADLAFGKKNIA